jgi:hypothetical protein
MNREELNGIIHANPEILGGMTAALTTVYLQPAFFTSPHFKLHRAGVV